jgi:hypothetical protein
LIIFANVFGIIKNYIPYKFALSLYTFFYKKANIFLTFSHFPLLNGCKFKKEMVRYSRIKKIDDFADFSPPFLKQKIRISGANIQ